jgi:hypothetical protein
MKKSMQRFVDVWKADFLAKFVAGEHKDTKSTIVFWVVFNTFVAFVLASSFSFFLFGLKSDILHSIDVYLPHNATITKSLGQ